ncbi:MAG: carotenoid oxygenase family protein [Myxococcales bacterium]|nr:carotenoid oxygenase family protein [Myxococcales bacterium]
MAQDAPAPPSAELELPFFLSGNFAPVQHEIDVERPEVVGHIPEALDGLFLRNGPNPKAKQPGHWFLGDGMLHGVALGGGEARFYKNRYLRTRALEGASMFGDDGVLDRSVSLANTHVVGHAGRIYALVEVSFPTLVDREMNTLGSFDFDGKLKTAMTAHPRICPETGELLFFGYDFMEPYLTFHRADAKGQLLPSEVVEVGGPVMMHDFAITRRHAIFLDLPILFDLELALQGGGLPYRWHDDYPARLRVVPRESAPGKLAAQTRTFEVEPGFIFHVMGAFEQEDSIVLTAVRYPELWRGSSNDMGSHPGHLHRYELDLQSGQVRESELDDRRIEFPRIDPRREGLPHRHGYALELSDEETALGSRIVKYDLEAQGARVHDFGRGQAGEPVFVPDPNDASEDAGWLMTFVYQPDEARSEFVILDARELEGEAVARIALPQRVPFGFHGSWIPSHEQP